MFTLTNRNANQIAFKTILITRLSIPHQNPKTKAPLTLTHAHTRIKLLLGLPADAPVEINIKQQDMNKLHQHIKHWNDHEHKRAAAAMQRLADKERSKDPGNAQNRVAPEGANGRPSGCGSWWDLDRLRVSRRLN